jgi:hypothetical protein
MARLMGTKHKLAGVTASGEWRVIDDYGRQVATANLYLKDSDYLGVDKGDVYELEAHIVWTLHEQDAA